MTRGIHKGIALAGLVAAALFVGCGGEESGGGGAASSDSAKPVELKYSTVSGEAATAEQVAAWWMDELKTRSDGQASVKPYYLASLVPIAESIPALQSGRIELAHFGPAHTSEMPLLSVVTVPFITEDPIAASKAASDLVANNPDVKAEIDKLGIVPVFWIGLTPTPLQTAKPVTSLDGLDGMRIRAIGYLNDALAAAGANPVDLPANEIYEATQRGVIDGMAAVPMDFITAFKAQEVAPFLLDPHLGVFNVTAGWMAKKTYDALPEPTKQAIGQLEDEFATRLVGALKDGEDVGCEAIKSEGGKAVALPPADVERWKSLAQAKIRDKWTKSTGVDPAVAQKVYDDYVAAVEKYAASSGYESGMKRCAGV